MLNYLCTFSLLSTIIFGQIRIKPQFGEEVCSIDIDEPSITTNELCTILRNKLCKDHDYSNHTDFEFYFGNSLIEQSDFISLPDIGLNPRGDGALIEFKIIGFPLIMDPMESDYYGGNTNLNSICNNRPVDFKEVIEIEFHFNTSNLENNLAEWQTSILTVEIMGQNRSESVMISDCQINLNWLNESLFVGINYDHEVVHIPSKYLLSHPHLDHIYIKLTTDNFTVKFNDFFYQDFIKRRFDVKAEKNTLNIYQSYNSGLIIQRFYIKPQLKQSIIPKGDKSNVMSMQNKFNFTQDGKTISKRNNFQYSLFFLFLLLPFISFILFGVYYGFGNTCSI